MKIDFVPGDHSTGLERILFAPELPLAYCRPQAVLNGPASEVLSHGQARRARIVAQLARRNCVEACAPNELTIVDSLIGLVLQYLHEMD